MQEEIEESTQLENVQNRRNLSDIEEKLKREVKGLQFKIQERAKKSALDV